MDTTVPVEVFLSYTREDQMFADELQTHLVLLRRQGLITNWHDREIVPGTEWETEISRHLDAAQIILMLVSPYFLASSFTYKEMRKALEKHLAGEARVIPIILRPCDWKNTPLGRLQALPKNGQPMTTWSDRDLAFLEVAKGIRQAIKDIADNPSSSLYSSAIKQPAPAPNPIIRVRLEQLASDLTKSYSYIRGYEDILRVTDDSRERAQAQHSIEKQSILLKHYLSEYQELARQVGLHIPPEIAHIYAYAGDTETRAVS